MTYESAVKELQTIVQQMENEEIDMDSLLEKVKRAKSLLVFCKERLRNVKDEIEL